MTLEQATITYDLGNGFSITAGKMLTYMGLKHTIQQTCINTAMLMMVVSSQCGQTIDAYDVGVLLIMQRILTIGDGQVLKIVRVTSWLCIHWVENLL